MKAHRSALPTLVAACAAALPLAALAACDVRSSAQTAALIELYTSEGCSSCPPADRQLSHLREALDPGAEAVPLSLHVSYWDYIGWKDPYAQAAFKERQRWLVGANGNKTVYTPQFFIAGSELRQWRGALGAKVREINAVAAAAGIRIQARLNPSGALVLAAEASGRPGARPAALYLALAENGLASNVTRGENSGTRLAHDHVVREWIGPINLVAGKARIEREIALPATWNPAQLEVVAFVQDEGTGGVLQALRAQQCAKS